MPDIDDTPLSPEETAELMGDMREAAIIQYLEGLRRTPSFLLPVYRDSAKTDEALAEAFRRFDAEGGG